MEKRIYLNLSITASITAILTSFLVSFFIVGSDNYLANFMSILPATVALLVFILIGLNIVSYFLTKNIMKPINELSKDIENFMTDKSLGYIEIYEELDPLLETIRNQKYEIEKYIGKLEEVNKYRRDFTANITHELKTPLTSINGFAEMIASGVVSKEDTIKFAHIINKEGNRLLVLIDSILNLSNIEIEQPNFESVNIKDVFSDIYQPLKVIADKSNIKIFFEIENLTILSDRRMLKDLLYNIVNNSIKYNKENGSVFLYIYKEKNNCIIKIEDTGIGISESDLNKIFDRFYIVEKSRNKNNSGTGLGLAIVKHIVSAHKGSIDIDSEIDKGTKIKIKLPISL